MAITVASDCTSIPCQSNSRGNYTYLLVLFLGVLIVSLGCTTMQSPKVLEPGEKIAGGSIFLSYQEVLGLEVFGRFGIAQNADFGCRISYLIPHDSVGIAADLKYQILRRPFYLAGDLEISMAVEPQYDDNPNYYYGVTPLLLAGTEHLYCGLKTTFAFYQSAYYHLYRPSIGWGIIHSDDWKFGLAPIIVVGSSIGEKFRVMPEISICFHDIGYPFLSNALVVAALGFQYIYGGKE